MDSGSIDPSMNEVNICLILKSERRREIKEFRPVSFYNVSYKIISKVLCQRLKRLLLSLVSETQSTFVAGLVISDNILVAEEAFHALVTKDKCRKEFIAVKTDISKACDRAE